jgi:hypothetical protein
MATGTTFFPRRRKGLLIHGGLALLCVGVSGGSFWLAQQQQVGAYFVLLLLFSLLLLPPLMITLYREYALIRGTYVIERDGLRLRWGLRTEDIPLTAIEWVRPAAQSGLRLLLPFASLPGAILGTRRVEGLGPIEYIASDVDTLLLVATPQKIFAISPDDPRKFQYAFQRAIEMGSLTPLPSVSNRPAAFLQYVWSDKKARTLFIVGTGLVLLLFVFTSLSIPHLNTVSLGYLANGKPEQPVPAARLLLLPVLTALVYGGDLLAGLFFYSQPLEEGKNVAYLLWLGSPITSILLMIATILIT